MQDGIYAVKFHSPQGSAGDGLVVVKDGSVNGGDGSHLYLGHLQADGDRLTGRLDVKQWNAKAASIFGPLGNFTLTLTGTASGDALTASGNVVDRSGLTIKITGRRVSAVA